MIHTLFAAMHALKRQQSFTGQKVAQFVKSLEMPSNQLKQRHIAWFEGRVLVAKNIWLLTDRLKQMIIWVIVQSFPLHQLLSVFEITSKFSFQGQHRAQRLPYVIMWHATCDFLFFSRFVHTISWKCHLLKQSSISDEGANMQLCSKVCLLFLNTNYRRTYLVEA